MDTKNDVEKYFQKSQNYFKEFKQNPKDSSNLEKGFMALTQALLRDKITETTDSEKLEDILEATKIQKSEIYVENFTQAVSYFLQAFEIQEEDMLNNVYVAFEKLASKSSPFEFAYSLGASSFARRVYENNLSGVWMNHSNAYRDDCERINFDLFQKYQDLI